MPRRRGKYGSKDGGSVTKARRRGKGIEGVAKARGGVTKTREAWQIIYGRGKDI